MCVASAFSLQKPGNSIPTAPLTRICPGPSLDHCIVIHRGIVTETSLLRRQAVIVIFNHFSARSVLKCLKIQSRFASFVRKFCETSGGNSDSESYLSLCVIEQTQCCCFTVEPSCAMTPLPLLAVSFIEPHDRRVLSHGKS